MKNAFRIIALTTLVGGSASALPPRDGDASVGVWRNPKNTVHLEAHYCGDAMCGRVVWASEKAIADAKRGGTDHLIGLELFHDFRKDKKGQWRGKVFVPDLNRTFSGTAVLVDHNTLKGTGCALAGFICKSQILTRIQ